MQWKCENKNNDNLKTFCLSKTIDGTRQFDNN